MKQRNKSITEFKGMVKIDETDCNTGEINSYYAQKTVKKLDARAGHFYITYLAEIISMIDSIGNKKMEVVKYILEHMDKHNNTLIMTTTEIANKSGISRATVIETLKLLQDAKVIERRTGAIMVSPKLINNKTSSGEGYLITKFESFNDESEVIDFPSEESKASPD